MNKDEIVFISYLQTLYSILISQVPNNKWLI